MTINRIATNTKQIYANSSHKGSLLYPDLSYKLQGCFFKVYNTLGFGHKEVVYQRALEEELITQQVPFEKEKHLSIHYEGKKIAEYIPDLVIDNKIIVEIKALEFLPNKIVTQLIYYLKGTNYSLGYLVNFGTPRLQIIRRIWTPAHMSRIRENSLLIRGNSK